MLLFWILRYCLVMVMIMMKIVQAWGNFPFLVYTRKWDNTIIPEKCTASFINKLYFLKVLVCFCLFFFQAAVTQAFQERALLCCCSLSLELWQDVLSSWHCGSVGTQTLYQIWCRLQSGSLKAPRVDQKIRKLLNRDSTTTGTMTSHVWWKWSRVLVGYGLLVWHHCICLFMSYKIPVAL